MKPIGEILNEEYAKHYARVNDSIDPKSLTLRELQGMQLMYGDLIAGLPLESKILDLGCGTGFLLNWLSKQYGIVPVGVDSSKSQLEVAWRSLPGLEIVCRNGIDYLREHPNTFSGILCTDVLEHIPHKDLCLEWVKAAKDALRPEGFFYCRMPNAANLTGSYSRYMDLTHELAFTSTSIIQLLEAGGLRDCRIMPVRASHLSGRIRLIIEQLLHRGIFRICGQGMERVFTNNVCAVGFKK